MASLAVLALVGATGCGGGDDAGDQPALGPPKTTATTTADEGEDARDTGADPTELEPLLVTEVPDGFQVQPDSVADTGPEDLDRAAVTAVDGTRAGREFLEEHGFVRGYGRLWMNGDQEGILVSIREFEDRQGALAQVAEGTEAIEGQGILATGSIEAIPDSTVFYAPSPFGATVAGAFVKGSYAVQVVADGTTRPAAESTLRRVAQEQFDRLP